MQKGLFLVLVVMGWITPGAGHASPMEDRPVIPTLARLSFRVPSQRMAEFEATYRERVVPILKAHGLVASSERGRATPDSIFSRLFEVGSPTEVAGKEKALQGDPAWVSTLRELGSAFKAAGTDSLIPHSFRFYSGPAGKGKAVKSGPGRTVRAGSGTGHWRTLDVTDGLVDGIVLSIMQDREGYLWFGTSNGASRYDGQRWTTFTPEDGLAGSMVRGMAQDRNGHIWFTTEGGGVSRYNPTASEGHRFTTFTPQDGLASVWGRSVLLDREGTLWFASYGGVSRYDGRKWTIFTTKNGLVSDNAWTIFQDRKGILWFGTLDGGVSRYDGKAFTTFTARDGLASNSVRSIFQDREGNFWFGTSESGVTRYDPSTPGSALRSGQAPSAEPAPSGAEGLRAGGRTFITFTARDGLAYNTVNSILQDREGNLWFGTYGGVSRYDGRTFTSFAAKDGMAHDRVWPVFQDREGNLWFGTVGGGVSCYDDMTFTTFTVKDGMAGEGKRILEDREGHLWFGTVGGGVSRYDGRTFTTFTDEDGLADNSVEKIFQDQEGNLWFATNNDGVSRYDGRTFTTFTDEDGLTCNTVTEILQDRGGNLWFGSRDGGVSRYDGRTFTTFTIEDGLISNWVETILQDREGMLWFGTIDGVTRYDGQTFTSFTTKDGLTGNNLLAILQDRDGTLWFGIHSGGVTRYRQRTFTGITTKDGLAHNLVNSILQGRDGTLWFGTWGGVSRYDGQVFQVLTRRDGLADNQVGDMIQDKNGDLWFGVSGGATRFRPPAPAPPPVFIDAVVADRRYEGVSEVALSSSADLTVFEFHGMSFKTLPEQMVYRYRLTGYDKDWRNTHDRRVEYHDLPRGTYAFEVQAVDRDLTYSEKPAAVTVRVHLPYERIGWVSVLVCAVGLAAWQTARVIRRDRRLAAANADLQREIEERRRAEAERARLDERIQQLHYLDRLRSALGTARSPDEVIRRGGEVLMEVLSSSGSERAEIDYQGRVWAFGNAEGSGERRYHRDLVWGGKRRGSLSLSCGVELSEAQERSLLDETAGQVAGALEARDLEAQILHSARLISMGQMAAGVAHELHQPLWAISTSAEDLYHRVIDGMGVSREQLRERMGDVLGLIARMTETIDHLRVFSRDKSQEPGSLFSVNETVHSSLRLIEAQLRGHGIALHLELSEGLPFVVGHSHQMEQVFLNLLSNARDALDERENSTAIHRREEECEKRLAIRTRREGGWVVAEVEDNGVGIEEAVRDRLFEPFFTTKPEDRGTGIGLSICHAIVQNHGGKIEVESKVGKGTTFRVRLPVEKLEG